MVCGGQRGSGECSIEADSELTVLVRNNSEYERDDEHNAEPPLRYLRVATHEAVVHVVVRVARVLALEDGAETTNDLGAVIEDDVNECG